jgi:uncharacterized protein (TIGR03435 family)
MTRWTGGLVAGLCAGIVLTALQAVAQEQTAPAKTFEAASVRQNKSGSTQVNTNFTQGGVTFTNMQLRPIIQFAYGINQPARLVGVPDWAESDRFDVVARGTINSIDDRRAMLQALLADRFKLVAHTEQRRVPVYTLVLARSDGRLGPNLKPSSVDCTKQGREGAPPPAATPNPLAAIVRCGLRPGGPGDISVTGIPIPLFGTFLSIMQRRPVIDNTGLQGAYEIHLTWAPDPLPGRSADPNTDGRADFFTALQEQLGLKLQAGTQSEDVLVIDSVSHPDEN